MDGFTDLESLHQGKSLESHANTHELNRIPN
jgi:hypothetical protein